MSLQSNTQSTIPNTAAIVVNQASLNARTAKHQSAGDWKDTSDLKPLRFQTFATGAANPTHGQPRKLLQRVLRMGERPLELRGSFYEAWRPDTVLAIGRNYVVQRGLCRLVISPRIISRIKDPPDHRLHSPQIENHCGRRRR